MKWKSLEAVEVISSKKKKELIGKAYKYKNYLVIDLFKKGTYYGRYAIDLDTGEYGFRDGTVTHQWKLSTIVGGSEVYYHYSKKRDVLECPDHHEFGKDAVHKNYEILREIQKDAQRAFEENHSRQQFMELMGRNYCIEESDGAEDSEEKKEEWGDQTMNGMITWI